jgi:hypothetical protein
MVRREHGRTYSTGLVQKDHIRARARDIRLLPLSTESHHGHALEVFPCGEETKNGGVRDSP